MAVTKIHLLANLLDHRYQGKLLSNEQIETAMNYVANLHADVLADVLKYRANMFAFNSYLFNPNINISPLSWWMAISDNLNSKTKELV